jgi:heme/copper-type cytochrome/quinol oxidase subunit 3
MVTIEGIVMAMLAATYLYLMQNFTQWPPPATPLPDLTFGTINMGVLLLSLPLMIWLNHLVKNEGGKRVILLLILIYLILAGISIYLRFKEFPSTHTWWDEHAYGSIVWWILGAHLVHIMASAVETIVMALYLVMYKLDHKRRTDLNVDSLYWYFVVGIWVPLYTIIYLVPRFL